MSVRTSRTIAVAGLALAFALLVPAAAFAATTPSTPVPTPTPAANGWYWPTNRIVAARPPGWLSFRTWYSLSNRAWHLAWDDVLTYKHPVYSLGYGRVVVSRMDISGYGPGGGKGGAMVVRYRTSDGTYFNALFGHIVIDLKKFPVGTLVRPGQLIATLNNYKPPHLHFGIHKGAASPKALASTPKKFKNTVSMLMGHTFEYTKDASGTMTPQVYGFVDPAAWLIGRSPWQRISPAPSRPAVPKRTSHASTFIVSGSVCASAGRLYEPVSVTVVAQRLVNGSWMRAGHWHGTISNPAKGAPRYNVRVHIATAGTWRLVVQTQETMDWTSASATPSKTFRVY